MAKNAPTEWETAHSVEIGRRVRQLRDERGMSAQKLADACARLGLPIARAVLSHLENGGRASISTGEVFVLAKALDVAPMDLLVGPGETEVVPGVTLGREEAAAWVAGAPTPQAFEDLAEKLAEAQAAVERVRRAMGTAVSGGRAPAVRTEPSQVNVCTGDVRPDASVHQAIDTALEHLGRLDSETMTETERTLAAALRSVCVAVMHKAAGVA